MHSSRSRCHTKLYSLQSDWNGKTGKREARMSKSNGTNLYLNFHSMFWLLQIVITYLVWQNFWNSKQSVFVTPQFAWISRNVCHCSVGLFNSKSIFCCHKTIANMKFESSFLILFKNIINFWHTGVFELLLNIEWACHRQNFLISLRICILNATSV